MNAQHASATAEHYTPKHVVEAARTVLGTIDLDPASCLLANEIVRATAIYTRASDGLRQPWAGNDFVNPPGGRTEHNQSRARVWWFRTCDEWLHGNINSAIFVAFSMELLQVAQSSAPQGMPTPLDLPFCIPSSRLQFLRETPDGQLAPGDRPTHANCIALLPCDGRQEETFARAFSSIGKVVMPAPRASFDEWQTNFIRSIDEQVEFSHVQLWPTHEQFWRAWRAGDSPERLAHGVLRRNGLQAAS
jgi:hypothetical protein